MSTKPSKRLHESHIAAARGRSVFASPRAIVFAQVFWLLLASATLSTASGAVAPKLLSLQTLDAPLLNSSFGKFVAGAGDVNGDGYSDIVASTSYPNPVSFPPPRVLVFLGSPVGVSPERMWAVNLSGPEMPAQSDSLHVSGVGDANADGFDDIAVGNPSAKGGGKVTVFLGSPGGLRTGPAWTIQNRTGTSADFGFGASVSGAGDMNGDGFADIVAGEPDYLVDAGRAHIILGGKTGLTSADSWTIENGRPDQGRLGLSVAGGSDLNADGFSDVIIGVPGSDGGNGSARAYLGSPSGLRTGLEWRIVGMIGVPGGWGLGRTVSAGADLDGDGYGDVAVSYFSHSESGPEMGIRVYLGSKSGFRTSDRWSLQPGSDEFAIMQGTGSEPPVGWVVGGLLSETGESAIKIVPATPEGLQLRSALEVVGGNSSSPPDLFRTGIVVSSAGDINRDGVPDVIVGEPAFENGTGRVDILLLGKEDIPPGKADSEWQRGMIVVVAVSSAAIVLLVGYLARRRRRLRQGPRAADPPQTGRTTDTGRKKHR